MKTHQLDGVQEKVNLAMKRYHAGFNNVVYRKATDSKGSVYANALIDEAMALCGHPHYKLSFRNWGMPAIAFLNQFTKEDN